MKRLKLATIIGCAAMMLAGSVLGVNASPVNEKITVQSKIYQDSETRALNLITYYRIYNGYLQYRRWNRGENEWYDPEWITIKPVES